jgi:hypothetical protein
LRLDRSGEASFRAEELAFDDRLRIDPRSILRIPCLPVC